MAMRLQCLLRSRLVAFFAAAIFLLPATTATAVTRDWIAGDGNWSEPSNWTPAGEPAAGDIANISFSSGVAQTVNYDYTGPAATLNSLRVDLTGSLFQATVLSMSANELSATTEYVGENGRGTFNQSGGTNTVTNLYVGFAVGSSGSYALSGAGTTANATTPRISYVGGGTGSLQITDGAVMNSVNSSIGDQGNCCGDGTSNGFATVSGAGSAWNNSGRLEVGRAGNGTLMIADGGTVVSSTGIIGAYNFANGTVTVNGAGSSWLNSGNLFMSGDSFSDFSATSATLNVNDGGTVFIGSKLKLWFGAIVNLNGGTIRFNNYERDSNASFNFTRGTIQLAGNRGVGTDAVIAEFFGSAPTIAFGKGLAVEGVATLQRTVILDGGTLSVGSLVGPQLLDFRRGVLNITNEAVSVGAGGTFATLDVAESMTVNATLGITNTGLVTGDGQIGGTFTNAVGGELRAQAGRSLKLTGAANTNDGQIKLLGGELDFAADLTNNAGAFISGNGSLLSAGLTNNGTMNFAGTANIVGPVTNAAGGKIISGGGGATIFYDDVTNNGEIRTSTNGFTVFFGSLSGSGSFTGAGTVNIEGDLSPGSSPAAVNFAGDVVLGPDSTLQIEIGGTAPGTEYDQINVAGDLTVGGTLEVSLIDGFTPTAGQTFDFFNAANVSGTFSSLTLPAIDGLTWNTSQLATGVLSLVPGLPGDYNQNGTVDAADYVLWRNGGPLQNDPTPGVQPGDYNVWRAHFGQTVGSGAATEGSDLAAVPEPGTMSLLAVSALAILSKFRRRSPRLLYGLAVALAFQLAIPAHAASLTATATGETQGPIDGLSIAEVTVGGADPRIVAIHDNQEGNVGPVFVSADLSGVGSATYGRLSGELFAQVENNGPANLNGVRARGQVRLGFDETALVASPTLPNGSPVTLTFRVDLASSAFLTPGASSFIDNGASTGFDARVTDLTTNQFAARFSGVSPTFVGPSSQTMTLDTQVGRTLRLFGDLTVVATARIDDNFTGMSIIRTGAAAALSARLFHQVSGDVVLQSESGSNYALPAALLGDYNQNGAVDAADYALWRNSIGFSSSTSLPNDDTAGVGNDDYDRWRARFGQAAGTGSTLPNGLANNAVPEPASVILLLMSVIGRFVARNSILRNPSHLQFFQ